MLSSSCGHAITSVRTYCACSYYPGFSETAPSRKTAQWAIFWKRFSFTAHGPLLRIKIVLCEVGSYYVFRGRGTNVRYLPSGNTNTVPP